MSEQSEGPPQDPEQKKPEKQTRISERENLGGMINTYYLKPPNITTEQLDEIFETRKPLRSLPDKQLAKAFEELALPMFLVDVGIKLKSPGTDFSKMIWPEAKYSMREKTQAITEEMAQRWWEDISEGKKTFGDLIKENAPENAKSESQASTEQKPPPTST